MKQLEVPRMIQIGSTGRNSGKTTLAKKIIETYQAHQLIYGLKIITISGKGGLCQRGEVGCGICTSIDSGFELVEENNRWGNKDTMALLQAGCHKVYLLKVFDNQLLAGFQAFLREVPTEALIVCESNSIREVVKPSLFMMMANQKRMKPTAARVIDKADLILETTDLPKELSQFEHLWAIKPETNVIRSGKK